MRETFWLTHNFNIVVLKPLSCPLGVDGLCYRAFHVQITHFFFIRDRMKAIENGNIKTRLLMEAIHVSKGHKSLIVQRQLKKKKKHIIKRSSRP